MQFRNPYGAHRTAGMPVVGRTWTDADIEEDDIAGVLFQDCVFERVRLVRSTLEKTIFLNSRFDDCVLEDCTVVETHWNGCTGKSLRIVGGQLRSAVFAQVKLDRLDIEQSGDGLVLAESEIEQLALSSAGCQQSAMTVSGSKFGALLAENARWQGASAVEIDLTTWRLSNASFERCSFIRAVGNGMDFSDVRFESCNLYQSEFRESRFRAAQGSIFAECELAEADFSEAMLDGALFANADAKQANFERARLAVALFPKATLTGARFGGALASGSVWTDANLTDAQLTSLDASRAVLRNARLDNADVANASFVEADLHGVDAPLTGADLRDSRGTVAWRAEREREARSWDEED